MNVLLLGGTGFVGKAIQRAVVRLKPPWISQLLIASRSGGEGILQVDVRDPFLIPKGVDVVVYAATPASALLNLEQPLVMLEQITRGVENLVGALRTTKQRKPKVVFLSSGAVLGQACQEGLGWSEGAIPTVSSCDRRNAYAIGKLYSEHLLYQAAPKFDFELVVARLFAFSGIGLPLSAHFAVGNFVDDVLAGRPIRIRGSGTAIRSYMDQSDLARWILRACVADKCSFPLHVGSEDAISITDLARLVASRAEIKFGKAVDVVVEGKVSPLDGLDVYLPQTSKTRRFLNEKQTVSLATSIDEMLEADNRSKLFKT